MIVLGGRDVFRHWPELAIAIDEITSWTLGGKVTRITVLVQGKL